MEIIRKCRIANSYCYSANNFVSIQSNLIDMGNQFILLRSMDFDSDPISTICKFHVVFEIERECSGLLMLIIVDPINFEQLCGFV